MKRYALIGRKLGHSWSQRWFNELFERLGQSDYSYELHEMPTLDGLRAWVEECGISGFNVTIPYKQQIIPLLDGLSPEAEAIGAVNCVRVINLSSECLNSECLSSDCLSSDCLSADASAHSNIQTFKQSNNQTIKHSNIQAIKHSNTQTLAPQGRRLQFKHSSILIGHNTDAPAFRDTLSQYTIHHSPLTSAIILGTGGAARAVGYALGQMGVNHIYVSRHPEAHPDLAPNIVDYNNLPTLSTLHSPLSTPHLLVNATPVGMWPDIDATPWPWSLDCFSLVYDLIYNPSPTLLLRQAAAQGAAVFDGLAMLHRQAELSWQLYK